MPALVAGIRAIYAINGTSVDGRDKPGHDNELAV
jgi:hypothetical protein